MIAIMADAYNAPELVLWYCANECPLGKNCREIPDMPPERAYVRLVNTLDNLKSSMKDLAEILDDGVIEQSEAETASQLLDDFWKHAAEWTKYLRYLKKCKIKKPANKSQYLK